MTSSTPTLNLLTFVRNTIRERKEQYRGLWIGLILCIAFISGSILLVASIPTSMEQKFKEQIGHAELVFPETSDSLMQGYVKDKQVEEYGLAKILGYLEVAETTKSTPTVVASLDDKARALLDLKAIQGRYPEKPGEIAVELGAMSVFGKVQQVGDQVEVQVTDLDGKLPPRDVSYTIVGIFDNKNVNIQELMRGMMAHDRSFIPSLYVAQEEDWAEARPRFVGYGVPSKAFAETMAERSPFEMMDVGRFPGVCLSYKNDAGRLSLNQAQSQLYLILGAVLGLAFVLAMLLAVRNSMRSVLVSKQSQMALIKAVGASRKQIIQLAMRENLIHVLITLPLGMGLSILVLKLIFSLGMKGLKLNLSPIILLVILISSALVVILTSLGPVLRASRISPMQAIRSGELVLKVQRSPLESLRQYLPHRLWAERQTKLYKNKMGGLSIFLALSTILAMVLTLGFQYSYDGLNQDHADYEIDSTHTYTRFDIVDSFYLRPQFKDQDVAQLMTLPKIKDIRSKQELQLMLEIDHYTPYTLQESPEWNENQALEGAEAYFKDVGGGMASVMQIKERYSIDKDLMSLPILALSEEDFVSLSEGGFASFDIASINAGQEVVLYAPDYYIETEENGWSLGYGPYTGKHPENTTLYSNDYFEAGMTLDLHYFYSKDPVYDKETGEFVGIPKDLQQLAISTKVVEVVDTLPENDRRHMISGNHPAALITTREGIRALGFDSFYTTTEIRLDHPIKDPELLKYLDEQVAASTWRSDHLSVTNWRLVQEANFRDLNAFVITGLAIFIVFMGIVGSIIHNTMTSRIRSSVRSIGTMRAVGATRQSVWASFRQQILRFFAWGTIGGYLIGSIAIFVIMFISKLPFRLLPFFVPLVMILIVFSLVNVSAYRKVNRIMKQSITHNIRHLAWIILALGMGLIGWMTPPAAIHATGNLEPTPAAGVEEPMEAPPRLMVTEAVEKASRETILPGDEIELKLTFKNVQAGMAAENILVSFQSMDGSLLPMAMADHYLARLDAGKDAVWTLPVKVLASAESGIHTYQVTFDYLDEAMGGHQSTQTFPILIDQAMRLEHDALQYPAEIIHGEVLDMNLTLMNVGKGKVHNVMLKAEVDGLMEGVSHLVGSMEAGTSQTGTLSMFIDPKHAAGDYEGTVNLSYENEVGASFQEELPVTLKVAEKMVYTGAEAQAHRDEKAEMPIYIWIIIAAVVLGLVIVIWLQAHKIRRFKEAESARL